jgi:hypothetical protein
MLSATVLAIFFVPIFFVAVRQIFKGDRQLERPPADYKPEAT